MSDFRPGVTNPQSSVLDEIRAELQRLNNQTGTMSGFMKELSQQNQKGNTRQDKFEKDLSIFFRKGQEKELLQMDYQGRQLKQIVDLNKQILKEALRSNDAVKKFQEAITKSEYQGKSRDIAEDYTSALRKSQNRNFLGTLGHHLGKALPGLGGLAHWAGWEHGGKSAPGDFMHRKKQEEQGLYNSASKAFEGLNRDTRGRAAVGDDMYSAMKGTEGDLDTLHGNFLSKQRQFMADNYASGYKRRGTGGGGGKGPLAADEAQAKQHPSAGDVAKQSAGTGQGFLLLYDLLSKSKDDPLGTSAATAGSGGGLLGSLMGILPALMGAIVPILIGGGILLTIMAAVNDTSKRNQMGADVRNANGLTTQQVNGSFGTSNLEASQLAANAKNGDKSGVSSSDTLNAANHLAQMNVSGPAVGNAQASAYSATRGKAPWMVDGIFKLTSDGHGGYLYGGVPVTDATAQDIIMSRGGDVANQLGAGPPWSNFAAKMSGRSFLFGGMTPGKPGEASLATVHGGEMVLTSQEVQQMRSSLASGGNQEVEKMMTELVAVNKALLAEMQKNTEVTARKTDGQKEAEAKPNAPSPSKQFQRSN